MLLLVGSMAMAETRPVMPEEGAGPIAVQTLPGTASGVRASEPAARFSSISW
jgi:hypothetical protein